MKKVISLFTFRKSVWHSQTSNREHRLLSNFPYALYSSDVPCDWLQ